MDGKRTPHKRKGNVVSSYVTPASTVIGDQTIFVNHRRFICLPPTLFYQFSNLKQNLRFRNMHDIKKVVEGYSLNHV